MGKINITETKLKNLFRETLAEVLVLEFMKLRADLVPYVSEKEQKEIEKLYKKPTRKIARSLKFKI
jgi:hypothetical protein